MFLANHLVSSGRAGLQARGALHHVHRRRGQARSGQAADREGLHGGPFQHQDGEIQQLFLPRPGD